MADEAEEVAPFGKNDGVSLHMGLFPKLYEVQFSLQPYVGSVSEMQMLMEQDKVESIEHAWVLQATISPPNSVGLRNLRLQTWQGTGTSSGWLIHDETQVFDENSDLRCFSIKKSYFEGEDDDGNEIDEPNVPVDCAWVVRVDQSQMTIGPIFRGAKVFGVEIRPLFHEVRHPGFLHLPPPREPGGPKTTREKRRRDTEEQASSTDA